MQVFRDADHASLPALLRFWAHVRVAIGPHGGALSNAFFMPPGGGVVELFPIDPVTRAPPPPLDSGGARAGSACSLHLHIRNVNHDMCVGLCWHLPSGRQASVTHPGCASHVLT